MKNYTGRQIEIMDAAIARIDQYGIQQLTIKNLASDINLSEPALYRHFSSKNEILAGLLDYFISEMNIRMKEITQKVTEMASTELENIFYSQFQVFTQKPAIVSVIFAESIFHFDEKLSNKVSEIMYLMHEYVGMNIKRGQNSGQYTTLIPESILTTIVIGAMRMLVLKWKLSGHQSSLMKDGKAVLSGILKMIENK